MIGQRDHTESLDCNWQRDGKLLRLLNRIRSALRDGWHDPVTHYSDVAWRLRLRARSSMGSRRAPSGTAAGTKYTLVPW